VTGQRGDDTHTADQYRWHLAAITRITARFLAGEIDVAGKRRLIAAENQAYYGSHAPGLLTRTTTGGHL